MSEFDSKEMERRSSAVTLSDMEVFIFPELMYSLVLANIMSPRIWLWRDNPWFAGLEGMSPYRRISKLKQYIMDNYTFNLDLETWGLTTRERELARFSDFISEDTLQQSNALFGYEGDRYYFNMDIRTHFGLDKYNSSVIPYWKTETVEAMDAFRYKPNYKMGAGECVSLAALYAAALFIVAGIPLEDIYLMATPLHSQDFIDIDDGILTNNRRLVTKSMWFNGTALSAQARRALENEAVTIVAHPSGYVHTVYDKATIDKGAYAHFADRLRSYLKSPLDDKTIVNFLRHSRDIQKCFQIRWPLHGVDNYISAERVFAYEHGSPYRINDRTRDKLLAEIDTEEFQVTPLPHRIVLNELEELVRQENIKCDTPDDLELLKAQLASDCLEAEVALERLAGFCKTDPSLPDIETKEFVSGQEPLGISLEMTREEIIDRLEVIRECNDTANMAFYAYRDLNRTEPWPFVVAAMQRNPVSIEGAGEMETSDLVRKIREMPDGSIYDGPGRLAQPDEVWNYGRGDGLEKAVLLANILHSRMPDEEVVIELSPDRAWLKVGQTGYAFSSRKEIREQVWPLSRYS
ncbi:MAG: hypothetical protein KAT53_06475, partial [Dehalococcoidia bacterium]|nr:hypothetical protein [Dehalococcoidia bacterium]